MTDRLAVLCGAKDCARKHPKAHRKLERALAADRRVIPSSCLGVCKGPVAVLDPLEERPVVLSAVRDRKARAAAIRATEGRNLHAQPKKGKKALLRARKAALRAR